MEIRKLQSTAAGTFIVTIPKRWTDKLKLHKGDLVSLELDGSDIVITPTTPKAVLPSRSLRIDEFKDQKLFELFLTSSYIAGNDVSEVVSKNMMPPEQKRWIRHATDGLIGVEIAEDYSNRVELQNLADPSRFEMSKILERFSNTSKAIFKDAIQSLSQGDLALAQDAYERGYESTKLYRLLMRLALQAINSRQLREEAKLGSVSNVVVTIIAIREMSRMAYYAMRIAQHVPEVEHKLEENLSSVIQKMTRTTIEMQEGAFEALISKEISVASSVIDRMPQVRKMYDSAQSLVMKQSERTALALSLIIRDIRAIAGYAVALADDAVLGASGTSGNV
jgi:phosphate uptake regulator